MVYFLRQGPKKFIPFTISEVKRGIAVVPWYPYHTRFQRIEYWFRFGDFFGFFIFHFWLDVKFFRYIHDCSKWQGVKWDDQDIWKLSSKLLIHKCLISFAVFDLTLFQNSFTFIIHWIIFVNLLVYRIVIVKVFKTIEFFVYCGIMPIIIFANSAYYHFPFEHFSSRREFFLKLFKNIL